jgi:hypothetical protein
MRSGWQVHLECAADFDVLVHIPPFVVIIPRLMHDVGNELPLAVDHQQRLVVALVLSRSENTHGLCVLDLGSVAVLSGERIEYSAQDLNRVPEAHADDLSRGAEVRHIHLSIDSDARTDRNSATPLCKWRGWSVARSFSTGGRNAPPLMKSRSSEMK